MSDPAVSLMLPWDEVTFTEGAKLAYDYDMSRGWRRYAGWFFVTLTQFGVVAALLHESIGLLLVSTLLVIYWYGLRWPMRRLMLQHFFARGERAQILKVALDDSGICLDKSCFPWESFQRALLADTGYLLELGRGTFLYFPKRVFADDKSREAFLTSVKRRIGNAIRIDRRIKRGP